MNYEKEVSLRHLYKTGLILGIMIFLNILFGPLVRATDSGLACPDWPLCYGRVLPPPEFQIWMEVGHRFYSGLITLALVYQFFLIFRSEYLREKFARLGLIALLIIILQIILGALTVTKLLDPTTVNLHLLNAVLFLLVIVTITLHAKVLLETKNEDSILFGWVDIFTKRSFLLLIIFAITYFQLYLGGRVSSHYAGLACVDWPTCNGEWLPKIMTEPIRYQIEHRFTAYLIFVLIFSNFLISIFKRYDARTRLFAKLALYLCGLQILIGVLNVLWKLPTLLTALHTGCGVALLVTIYISLFYNIIGKKASEKIKIPVEEGMELA